jgi:hypothetical protein
MNKRKESYFSLDPQSGSVSITMLSQMHPAIVLMIAWTNLWCHNHGINTVWTSWMRTPEQNRKLNATSVHEYRGADLSILKKHGWTKELVRKYELEFQIEFHDLGALVGEFQDFKSVPIKIHNSGHGKHAHLQCRP